MAFITTPTLWLLASIALLGNIPKICRADGAIYINHGSEEMNDPSGVELVCLGKASNFRSCQAARTRKGQALKAVAVPIEEATNILRKLSREIPSKKGALRKENCRGNLSYVFEWEDRRNSQKVCEQNQPAKKITRALLKAEHQISGILNP